LTRQPEAQFGDCLKVRVFPYLQALSLKFDTEWCAYDDPADKRNTRNVTCGVCGPIYNGDPRAYTLILKRDDQINANVTSFERSSSVYTGKIVRTYKKGELITIKLRVCLFLDHSQYLYKFSVILFLRFRPIMAEVLNSGYARLLMKMKTQKGNVSIATNWHLKMENSYFR
jgi:hypothetical protein